MAPWVQIVIAIIGLVGSIFVAWLTTGARFGQELKEAQQTIETLTAKVNSLGSALDASVQVIEGLVPTGAVVAFRTADCPAGWEPRTELAGRVIIGAGFSDYGSEFALWERGRNGRYLQLTVDQLPTHDHGMSVASNYLPGQPPSATGAKDALSREFGDPFGAVGSGNPIDILPPFRALYYCER